MAPSGGRPHRVVRFARLIHRRVSRCLIIPLIIRTIRLDPSGPDQIDGPSHLSRPDPFGADQIDAEHQATDLVPGCSRPRHSLEPGWMVRSPSPYRMVIVGRPYPYARAAQ